MCRWKLSDEAETFYALCCVLVRRFLFAFYCFLLLTQHTVAVNMVVYYYFFYVWLFRFKHWCTFVTFLSYSSRCLCSMPRPGMKRSFQCMRFVWCFAQGCRNTVDLSACVRSGSSVDFFFVAATMTTNATRPSQYALMIRSANQNRIDVGKRDEKNYTIKRNCSRNK